MTGAPLEVLERVPLFADLDRRELTQIAQLFKERRFAAGDTVIMEGSGGAAFFVIDAGEAEVTVRGQRRGTLRAGDYFGELALIDAGVRSATVTATSDLVLYGLTFWDFRPVVRGNGEIGWKLLQVVTQRLRAAEARE